MEEIGPFIPIIIMGVVAYMLILRPQMKKTKEHQLLTQSIESGDEVLLNSGIYGFVNEVEAETLWLEVSDGVEMKVSKAAIQQKVVVTD